MTRRVIHPTPFRFPLDDDFYGQTVVIGNHVKNSSLDCAVTFANIDKADASLVKLNERIARERFGVPLLKSGVIGTMRRVKGLEEEGYSTVREELESRAEDSDFMGFLTSGLGAGPVCMAIHHFGSGYGAFREMKKTFGRDVNFALHLHCLADYYLGNMNRSELTNGQKTKRENLHQLLAEVKPSIVAVSSATEKSFRQHGFIPGSYPIHVIRNGVSTDLYNFVSEQEKEDFRKDLGIEADKLVGYVGRIDAEKGANNLLKILQHFDADPGDIGFVIASAGGRMMDKFISEVERTAPHLVDSNRVKIVYDVSKLTSGFYSKDDEAHRYFSERAFEKGLGGRRIFADVVTKPVQPRLDVYLHPATSEALALSVVEAAMSGVPIVASDIGGIPEVANYNNGHLVDIGSRKERDYISEFADAIVKWSRKGVSREYAGTIRQNLIEAGFSAEAMAKKLDVIYTRRENA